MPGGEFKLFSKLLVFLLAFSLVFVSPLPLSLGEGPENPSLTNTGSAPGSLELTDMRTHFSKTFLREDGLYQTEVSLAPIFREDEYDHLRPVEELFTATDQATLKEYGKGKDRILLARNPLSSFLFSLSKGEAELSFQVLGANLSAVTLGASRADYTEIFPGVDLRYTLNPNFLKEEIVLKSPNVPPVISFRFFLKGLEVAEKDDGLHLISSDTGEEAFLIPPLSVFDAQSKTCTTFTTITQRDETFLNFSLMIDQNWLSSQERVFPVVVDPTIIIQPSSSEALLSKYDDGWQPVMGGYAWYLNYWQVGEYDPRYGEIIYHDWYRWEPNPIFTLFEFNLPSLPTGASIQEAKLILKKVSSSTSPANLDLHRVTSSWANPTWNNRPSQDPNGITGSWDEKGCLIFDVTSVVSSWLSGTSTNYGFSLEGMDPLPDPGPLIKDPPAPPPPPQGAVDKYVIFANRNASNLQDAPRLNIVYSAPEASGQNLGRELYWTYWELPLPLAAAGVNVSNGNLVLSQTDLNLPSRGFPTLITRTYNSRSNRTGLFGYGWTSSLELKLESSANGSRVDFFDADGTCHPFYRYKTASGLDYYRSPPGFSGSLLRNTATSTYSLSFQDGSKYNFDSTGKVFSFIDPNGNTMNWEYSGGQLVRLKDSVNRQINFSYTNGKITSITDYSGRTFTYFYSGGFLQTVTYSPTVSVQFTYTSSQLVTYCDPNLKNWNFAYDGQKISSALDPLGRGILLSYPTSSRTLVQTALGYTWAYNYSVSGLVTFIVDPMGNPTSFTYDTDYTLTSVTNPKGQKTSYEWNNQYRVRTITDSLGNTITATYNSQGKPISIKDQRGNVTTYTYDAKGNLLTSSDPLGNTTSYTYDSYGQLIRMLAPLTSTQTLTTTFTYDSYGNCTQVTDPGEHTTTSSYTLRGQLLYQITPLGQKTSYTYDTLDRLITITDTTGNWVSFSYDPCGRLLSKWDALGPFFVNTYDDAGRLIRTSSPTLTYYDGSSISQITQYVYDDDGRLIQLIDPAGKTTSYSYDALNRLLSIQDPAGRTSSYSYDELNLVSSTNPNGQSFSYSYDALNHLVQISAPSLSINYSYLPNGLLESMTDPTGTYSYTYNAANLLTQAQTPQGTISYSYNKAGLRTSATYPGGKIQYSYDSHGRLSRITRPDNSYTNFFYDNGDRLTQLSHYSPSNSLILGTNYGYDALNRVTSIQNAVGPLLSLSYSYDIRSNVTSKVTTTSSGTITCTYSFDPLGHMISSSWNGSQIFYAYDSLGNRTRMSTPSGTSFYSYDQETG
ncbi:MAG: DUF6531 domain-containing protein, partial [Coprothermobacterota bacterium]|nr:DUF6531 domain-containing protein [Coprothermobacterota bacterium]